MRPPGRDGCCVGRPSCKEPPIRPNQRYRHRRRPRHPRAHRFPRGSSASRRYVTAILLCLDPASHTLEAVSAGHNPAFLVAGGERILIKASGTPLGMLPNRTYEIERFPLVEGAQILLYTDGLTEVFQGDEEFGEERLLALIAD
ncbi:MAG: serine/threonine-protein phosphatase [Bryobacteraceae bacterium]|nr:serine/threonine-protein phosphatase [Bryobacteraceae bacterium]